MQKLRLGMLNCHGIIEKFDTPEFQDLVSSNDIFGVCETWLSDNNAPINIPGFNFYPLNRKNEMVTRGGLGVFIKVELKKHVKVMYNISSENILWCKVTKTFLNFDEDLYIGITYIPPEYSSREKRLNVDHFLKLSEKTSAIPSEKIILLGDFNARTSNKDDRLLQEKHDTEDAPEDFFSHIKQKRTSQDKQENKYGKLLIEYCATTHSYIANGRTLGDFQGKYTCHETRGSSTVDYAVVNESLKKLVTQFRVLTPYIGSDHCPITLHLMFKPNNLSKMKNSLTTMKPKIRWNDNTRLIFEKHINSVEAAKEMDKIESLIDNPSNMLDRAAEKVGNIFIKALRPKSGPYKPRHNKTKPKNGTTNPAKNSVKI